VTTGLSCGGSQSYKVERIDVRKVTACWPARRTGYRSLAASAPRQRPASRDGNGAGDDRKSGKGNSPPDGSADSHALGLSQGVMVIGLRVRIHTETACVRSEKQCMVGTACLMTA